jgi:hypothetical protein
VTRRTFRRALLAALAAALVPVGIAGADNSVGFVDTVGDAGASIDIKRVDIESSDRGWLSFKISVDGFFTCSSDGDGEPALVALDLDQNPDTGSAFYGTEVELAPDSIGDAHLYRAHDWDFRGVPGSSGLGGGCGPGVGYYSIDTAQLGLEPGGGFNVVVAAIGPKGDTAPDLRTFNYQQVPGTKPPALGRDRRAPHVIAYASTGVHGRRATLRYWTLDGRARTREVVRVFRGRRLLRTIRTPLRDSNPFHLSQLSWRVPQQVRGKLRFSVRSTDEAGNRSAPVSAALVVR